MVPILPSLTMLQSLNRLAVAYPRDDAVAKGAVTGAGFCLQP
jgi:hypothetical protein